MWLLTVETSKTKSKLLDQNSVIVISKIWSFLKFLLSFGSTWDILSSSPEWMSTLLPWTLCFQALSCGSLSLCYQCYIHCVPKTLSLQFFLSCSYCFTSFPHVGAHSPKKDLWTKSCCNQSQAVGRLRP